MRRCYLKISISPKYLNEIINFVCGIVVYCNNYIIVLDYITRFKSF